MIINREGHFSGMTEWAQLMDLWGDIIQNEKQSFDTVVRKRNMPIGLNF